MEYIADTEFIPKNIDQDPELFKILYLSLTFTQPELNPEITYAVWCNAMIYDLITPVPEGMRGAIANTWIYYIQETIDNLSEIASKNKEKRVYIPFIYRDFYPEEIIYNYRLIINLLNSDIECHWKMDSVVKWLIEHENNPVFVDPKDLKIEDPSSRPGRDVRDLDQQELDRMEENYIKSENEINMRLNWRYYGSLSQLIAENLAVDMFEWFDQQPDPSWENIIDEEIICKELIKRNLTITDEAMSKLPQISYYKELITYPYRNIQYTDDQEKQIKQFKEHMDNSIDYYHEYFYNENTTLLINKKKQHPGKPSTFQLRKDLTDSESYCLVYLILRLCCDIVKKDNINLETENGNKLLKHLTISAIRAITNDKTEQRKKSSSYSIVINGFDKLGYEHFEKLHSELSFYLNEMKKTLVPTTTKYPAQRDFFKKALDIDVSSKAIDRMVEQLKEDYSDVDSGGII